ncbi:MAG: methionine adenosyltransferase [Deltaproteobacteria bacterium]|nr:methionine adenosyltransferase [Deltaproteobacteria bacterium]
MELRITPLEGRSVDDDEIEIVERKGLGHPDTICDALAEEFSRSLSRCYLERCGQIVHHNVDKILLRGGTSHAAFGGGSVVEPIEIYLAGRAITELDGVAIPVEELAVEGSRSWLGAHLHALDPDRHVRIRSMVRPGSADLLELYSRQRDAGSWLANDTSCGVGYAPLSDLEQVVHAVEHRLSDAARREERPEAGEDVKVMGVRVADRIQLTVGCAMIGRYLEHIDDYLAAKVVLAGLAVDTARKLSDREVEVKINAADDPSSGSVFLTVTGTSAESGDDGEAGRGNRANGLITPHRPMTLESVAGKNPVTHVGKLYNIVAGLIAQAIVEELPEIAEAQCMLVSRIGHPITQPQIAQVRIRTRDGVPVRIDEIVREQLDALPSLQRELVDGTLAVDRWPFRA